MIGQVAQISTSRKGTVWVQIKLLEGEAPSEGSKVLVVPEIKEEPQDEKSSELV